MEVSVMMMVVAFSSHTRILGAGSMIHFMPTLFFFFLKWIAHAHQFHSLGQDQSTVAQWEVGIIHVQSEFVKL